MCTGGPAVVTSFPVAENPQVNLPAACAECVTTTQMAHAGDPQQSASKVFRSADGKMRVDSGAISVITDPAKQQTIFLDHVKKEARIIPFDQGPAAPALPGAIPQPTIPEPKATLLKVEDLGKSFIDGHEVEGKRYTLKPPDLPAAPGMPKPPSLQPPGLPAVPPPPNTHEIWTSTKLKLPVLTKTTGGFGEQVQRCKVAEMGPAAPTLFEAPADYKQLAAVAAPKQR